jgi:hypothetical protein
MIYKAVAVPLTLSCLMFAATSFARKVQKWRGPHECIRHHLHVTREREECYAMIAAVAEMSRVVGRQQPTAGMM